MLFKCFDSTDRTRANCVPHSAFHDPMAPPNAAPRESIEVRTVAFSDPGTKRAALFHRGEAKGDAYPDGEGGISGGYFTPSSSTSKISVAFGGMTPPAPLAP